MNFSNALHRRYPTLRVAQLEWNKACAAGLIGPPGGRRQPSEVLPTPIAQPHPILEGNHPTLCAIRYPTVPLASNEMWYAVTKGTHPGVYLGRSVHCRYTILQS